MREAHAGVAAQWTCWCLYWPLRGFWRPGHLEVVARAALMALGLLMLVWTARPRRRGLDVVAMPLAMVAVIERGASGRKAAISPQCFAMLGGAT